MKKAFLIITFLLFYLLFPGVLIAQYSFSLGINQAPELIISELPDLTYSGNVVQLGLTDMVSGGSGEYFYHWEPELGLDDPNIAQPLASPEIDITYTLNVTDGNGCSLMATQDVTTDLTGSGNHLNQARISIYPVPAKNLVHLTVTGNVILKELSVFVFDIAGHVVMNKQLTSPDNVRDYSIDLSALEPGSYLMVVTSPDIISNHVIILQ